MKIYVDADACPVAVKEVLFKAAERVKVKVILVANKGMRIPNSQYIELLVVGAGIDVADEKIVELAESGDIAISSDIPLADGVVSKGGVVITPRGQILDVATIKERLAIRDMLTELRSQGIETAGPPAFSVKDKEKFANQLNRILTKMQAK